MKLPQPNLSFDEKLDEFDIWVTPYLSEITDSEKFKTELDSIAGIFEVMGEATNNFNDPDDFNPGELAENLIEHTDQLGDDERQEKLEDLASLLFLVTGKSDNRSKCQLPLYLRDEANWDYIPDTGTRKGEKYIREIDIPRTVTTERFMKITSQMIDDDIQKRLLSTFINFVLRDKQHESQLWSLGHGYYSLKEFEREKDLLAPIVIYKVRGSVMAKSGHEPEDILRDRLKEFGLQGGIDYNNADVTIIETEDTKSRAFDFVIPFRTERWNEEWENRIFVQCQFYAGDSGSVSHKNVDQAKGSQREVGDEYSDAIFLQYVDGAGYHSSLNSDLKNLLHLESTKSFFQLRSSPIRLRREIQQKGFLIPLEVEHAALRTGGDIEDTKGLLLDEGYSADEIDSSIRDAEDRGVFSIEDDEINIHDDRRSIVRRYFILDVVARFGEPVETKPLGMGGKMLIPGYGDFYGMPLKKVSREAQALAPTLEDDWSDTDIFLEDIEWLTSNGFAMSR